MSQIEELQGRVAMLEKTVAALGDLNTAELRSTQSSEAMAEAILSLVEELAIHAGIPKQEFLRHYDKRFAYYYGLALQKAEDISPSLAAELDTRPIADVGTHENFPPLFGEPPATG